MLEIIGRSIRAIAMLLQVTYDWRSRKSKKEKNFFEKIELSPNFQLLFQVWGCRFSVFGQIKKAIAKLAIAFFILQVLGLF